MKRNILRIIFLILVIINASVIFYFSAQDGKSSEKISQKIVTENMNNVKTTNKSEKDKILKQREKIVRKIAHVLIYTSLGIWTIAFALTFKMSKVTQIVSSICFGAFYAGTDELHQRFISGRSGNITDVFIDTIGVLIGIAIVLLVVYIYKKIKEENKGEKMKKNENGVTLIALAVTLVVMMILASSIMISIKGDPESMRLANEKKREAEILSIKEDIKTYLTEHKPQDYHELLEMLRQYGTILNEDDTVNAKLKTDKGNYTIYISDIWNINPEQQ